MASRHMSLLIREMQLKLQVISSHLSEWPSYTNQQTTSVGQDVEKGNPHTLLVRMQTGAVTVENRTEFPQRAKNETALCPTCNPTSGNIAKETRNTETKVYIHLMFIAELFTTAKN